MYNWEFTSACDRLACNLRWLRQEEIWAGVIVFFHQSAKVGDLGTSGPRVQVPLRTDPLKDSILAQDHICTGLELIEIHLGLTNPGTDSIGVGAAEDGHFPQIEARHASRRYPWGHSYVKANILGRESLEQGTPRINCQTGWEDFHSCIKWDTKYRIWAISLPVLFITELCWSPALTTFIIFVLSIFSFIYVFHFMVTWWSLYRLN